VTRLCNTAPHPLTEALNNWSSILTLKTVKSQLLNHRLSPALAHQQLLTVIAALPTRPCMTEVAAEAALHKLTWRLPFIFDTKDDTPCTLSASEASQIYADRKNLCKSQVTKCTNRFTAPEEALQAITDHVHVRFTRQDPTLFQNWAQLMPILAGEVQELIDALHSKDAQAIVDEAGDVLYVSCYGLRFTTEIEGEIAATSKPVPWSQMHHLSPNSDEMTNFIDNVTRLQRLTSGGAELTELWFEAQSLGAQWCAMTGDTSTPTIEMDAVLFGPPWYSQTPSRIQLRHGLQSLL
jgi:NTP pyrophosphatase (non-canonical NTP hydrolase)